jgi:hypothetical protein
LRKISGEGFEEVQAEKVRIPKDVVSRRIEGGREGIMSSEGGRGREVKVGEGGWKVF